MESPTTADGTPSTIVKNTPPFQRLLHRMMQKKTVVSKDVRDTPSQQRLLRGMKQKKPLLDKRKCVQLKHDNNPDEGPELQIAKKRKVERKGRHLIKDKQEASTSTSKGGMDQVLEAETTGSSADELKPKNRFGLLDI